MMTDARSEMLTRIRAALRRPVTPAAGRAEATDDAGAPAARPAVPRAYRAAGEHAPGSAEALALLVDRLVDYRASVVRVAEREVPGAIAAALRAADPTAGPTAGPTAAAPSGIRTVVVPPGLDPAWLTALHGVLVYTDTRDAPLSATELDALGAVVTAARVAIAETGTIVLDAEPDQGRRAISLVPDVHVCVVRAEQVVQTVPEAVRLLAAHTGRPQTWISGPSATSDIELDRVEGVHGPRVLHVIVVA